MANDDKKLTDITSILDDVLEDYTTEEIEKVDKEGNGNFEELPEGYYLCEIESAELNISKNSGKLMASFKCKAVDNGIALDDNDNFVEIQHTKNRYIFKHYVLQNDDPKKQKDAIDRLIQDIKKFEGDPGVPLVQPLLDELKSNNISKREFIMGSLEFLTGMQIYIMVEKTEKSGQTSVWYRLISWERASNLKLPGAAEEE